MNNWLSLIGNKLRGVIRRNRNLRGMGIAVVSTLIIGWLAASVWSYGELTWRTGKAEEISFSAAYDLIVDPDFSGRAERDTGRVFIALPDGREKVAFVPLDGGDLVSALFIESSGDVYDLGVREHPAAALVSVFTFGILIFLVGYVVRMTGAGRSVGDVVEVDDLETRFEDVAGAYEAVRALSEFVGLIRGRLSYGAIGAQAPKGVLLVGPPGTGKTLLARATAGEARVNFVSVSGSDFGGMLVGQGARDVGALFRKAARMAPCIGFIDEIDAIGKKRGFRSHDDYDTTLNKLLAELDGITGREGVYVIAATNRLEILDDALVRPGRFDRTITVSLPDARARRRLLEIHTRDLALSDDIDLDQLARKTVGLSGAQLEALANEAGLQAGRLGASEITQAHFEEAQLKTTMGCGLDIKPLTDLEKRTVAVHEAGHALVAYLDPEADEIERITIEPRGQSLGHVAFGSGGDQRIETRSRLMGRLQVALAGREAERLVFGDVSTLAGADLAMANQIAFRMATEYEMSSKRGLSGGLREGTRDGATQAAVSELLKEAEEAAAACLSEHQSALRALSERLADEETLTRGDVGSALGPQHDDRGVLEHA